MSYPTKKQLKDNASMMYEALRVAFDYIEPMFFGPEGDGYLVKNAYEKVANALNRIEGE